MIVLNESSPLELINKREHLPVSPAPNIGSDSRLVSLKFASVNKSFKYKHLDMRPLLPDNSKLSNSIVLPLHIILLST